MEKRDKKGIKQFKYSNPRQKKPLPANAIFGTRAVLEAIKAGKEIDKLFIQRGIKNELTDELMETVREQNIACTKVPVEKLNRITRKNHQGVIAFLSAVQFRSLDHIISESYAQGKDPFLLVLDRVTDVRNFGAIARSAECAGVQALIVPAKGAAALNSDAVKTSAGALHHIAVCRENNLKHTVEYLQKSGVQVIAATEKTDQLLYDIDLKGPLAIVMGSEEDGVSPEILQIVDHKGKIPMTGNISSLNVSVAAGIYLFEALRQRV
ncbi:MAG: 23S rRNA (guanosine(2251)-2'-O)-methyltransferase RlmB [Cytophagales bacterium]|nr:23S rRNA (guanosine(2251)-2'-O)-methyltransferase RlmB [Cytophagales bacterium]